MEDRKTALHLALCLLWQSGTIPTFGAAVTGDGSANAAGSSGTAANVNGIKSNAGVVSGDIELNPEDGSASVPVEMKVAVIASLIPVSLPADGFEFTVNPEQPFGISAPAAQIANPDVTIVSHSVVPVKLEMADVPEVGEADVRFSGKFSNYAEQSFRLVDTMSGVGPPGIAILMLGARDRRYGNDEELEHYAIRPNRTGIFVAEIPAEGEVVLKLYGRMAPDSCGTFEFTVRPALEISTARANGAADSYKG